MHGSVTVLIPPHFLNWDGFVYRWSAATRIPYMFISFQIQFIFSSIESQCLGNPLQELETSLVKTRRRNLSQKPMKSLWSGWSCRSMILRDRFFLIPPVTSFSFQNSCYFESLHMVLWVCDWGTSVSVRCILTNSLIQAMSSCNVIAPLLCKIHHTLLFFLHLS